MSQPMSREMHGAAFDLRYRSLAFVRRFVDEWNATCVADPDEINHEWRELYLQAKEILKDAGIHPEEPTDER